MLIITSLPEYISLLEEKKQEKREKINKTRTKQESYEVKGEMLGLQEAIDYARALEKGLTPEGQAMADRERELAASKERESKKALKPLAIAE